MTFKTITLHSSRGGTGKTLISTNIAAILAKKGFNVALLDLDFRAPSFTTVFSEAIKKKPGFWINDYLIGNCGIIETLIDVSSFFGLTGKLYIGPANPSPEAVGGSMECSPSWGLKAAKRLISLKTTLPEKMAIDYCILDTSPGIQRSSINAIMCSDLAVIVTTLDSIDLEGVKSMLKNFYDIFEAKTGLIINKAFPQTLEGSENQKDQTTILNTFDNPILGIISCYCDVLQNKRDRLIAFHNPLHPFTQKLQEITKEIEKFEHS